MWGYGRMSATQHATRNMSRVSRLTFYVSRFTLDVIRSPFPLLALLLLAFALRVHALDFQPLWFDEGKSVFFANQEMWDTALLTAEDIHPPLYYILLHAWAFLAEWSPFVLRFLSAIASLVTVPLIYQLGTLLSGRRLVGLLAAAILTLSPFHVYYAQEARMYALVTALGLASTVLMLRALTARSPRWLSGRWIAYLVVTAAALYTHYYAAFIPLFQTAFVLLHFRRYRRDLLRWIGSMAILGLAYAPWVYLSYEVLTEYVVTKVIHEAYPPLALWEYLTDHLTAFSAGTLGDGTGLTVICVALAILGLIAAWQIKLQIPNSKFQSPASCLLLYLFAPLVVGFAINQVFPFHPPHYERQFLYVAPAFYLLVAFGLVGLMGWVKWIAQFAARRAGAAPGPDPAPWNTGWGVRIAQTCLVASTLLTIVALDATVLHAFYITPRHVVDDYRPLIARARALARSGDVVVCIYPWQVGYFQSYLSGSRPTLYYVDVDDWNDIAHMEADLDTLLGTYPRLWFPSYQVAGRTLETRVETYLSQQAHIIEQGWHENNKLSFYVSPRPLPAPIPGARFGDMAVLNEYQMANAEFQSAWGVIPVRLNWRLLSSSQDRFLVTLRLANARGDTWTLSDSEPQAGLWPFSLWSVGDEIDDLRALLIPAGTPPGAYSLYLSLHRVGEGQPLSVTGFDGAKRGVELLLGQVTVIPAQERPPLEALSIQHRREADFGDVRLLGYSMGPGPLQAGQPVPVTLFWQAHSPPPGDYVLAVELHDEAGRNWTRSTPRPLGDLYPTSQWHTGEFVTDRYEVVPATGVSKALRLVIAVYDAASQPVGKPLTLQTVLVTGREPSYAVPEMQYPILGGVRLGNSVLLLGYDLDPQAPNRAAPLQPGQTLTLTLYWQCLAPMNVSYKVFTHLIRPESPTDIWAQDDAVPGQGTTPTTGWVSGEVLTDTHRLVVKPETLRGTYRLSVGMYDPITNARLPTTDRTGQTLGDHVLLQDVQIEVAYP